MYLAYVNLIGEESDGYYRYEFIYMEDGDNFDVVEDHEPCCLSETITPLQGGEVHNVMTKIKLSLIQDNCCFSFEHAKLGIVALAYEDITEYDSYPEDGRLVFHFGDDYNDVERKLNAKGCQEMFLENKKADI